MKQKEIFIIRHKHHNNLYLRSHNNNNGIFTLYWGGINQARQYKSEVWANRFIETFDKVNIGRRTNGLRLNEMVVINYTNKLKIDLL